MHLQLADIKKMLILFIAIFVSLKSIANECNLTEDDIDQVKKYVPCLVSENRLACGAIIGASTLAASGLLAPSALKTYLVQSIEGNKQSILKTLASEIENAILSANAISNQADYAKYVQELEAEVDALTERRERLLEQIEERTKNPSVRASDRIILQRTSDGRLVDTLAGSKDEALKESLESLNNRIAEKNADIKIAKRSLFANKAPFFKVVNNLSEKAASMATAVYDRILSGAKSGEDIYSKRFISRTVTFLDGTLEKIGGSQFANILKRSVSFGITTTAQAVQATRGFGAAALRLAGRVQASAVGRGLSTAAGRVFTSTAGRIFVGATSLTATLLTYSGDLAAADFSGYYNGEFDPAPSPPVLTEQALKGLDRPTDEILDEVGRNERSCKFYQELCESYAQCGDKIEKPVCYGNKATLKIRTSDRKVYEQTYIFADSKKDGIPVVRTVQTKASGAVIQKNYTDEGKISNPNDETLGVDDILTSKYALMAAAICGAPAQEQAQILASFRIKERSRTQNSSSSRSR